MNISYCDSDWYTMFNKGDYSTGNISDSTYIQLISALEKAGEIEENEIDDYRTCFDNIKEAGSKFAGDEKYYFNKVGVGVYDKIEKNIELYNINSELPEVQQEEKKTAFKKYSQEDYKSCPMDETREEYWKVLKDSSKFVSNMNKDELNLYVKCLNAFKNSPGGIELIGSDTKIQEEINGILIGISSTYYDKLDKDSKDIMEETGNIEDTDIFIFKQPSISDSNTNTTDSIDGLLSDSETFLSKGENNKINDNSIQNFSQTMYNILITIATFVAVLVGGILGIKIMISSVEEQARVKELLIPYVIGCVVVFGAFGLWKLIVSILQAM